MYIHVVQANAGRVGPAPVTRPRVAPNVALGTAPSFVVIVVPRRTPVLQCSTKSPRIILLGATARTFLLKEVGINYLSGCGPQRSHISARYAEDKG